MAATCAPAAETAWPTVGRGKSFTILVRINFNILRFFGAHLQEERAELEDLSEFIREGRNLEVLAAEVEPLADRVAQARLPSNKTLE